MGKLLHQNNEFIVIDENCGRGVVLINTKGKHSNHGHLKRLDTALMMIRLIQRRIVPKSDYLRQTAIRVSVNDDYIQTIQSKIDKDKNRTWYRNINKGLRK